MNGVLQSCRSTSAACASQFPKSLLKKRQGIEFKRYTLVKSTHKSYGIEKKDVALMPSATIEKITTEPKVKKILVANRGEIAVRVIRAGNELGLRTVAIYSPADRLQPHRYKADESYQIGTEDMKPVSCYLDIEGIIAIAKENDVDAIHPGYGFLSENSMLARRCKEEGLIFVGPSEQTINSMGDKTAARSTAIEVGVPVVPGLEQAVLEFGAVKEFAEANGYPLMLKAAMGGGGRGMRVVRVAEELEDAFQRASAEASAAFGDGRMFVEKFIEEPRHVEIQILADTQGSVVHLYERDCSIQRRHQKVVEIAPAPQLDDSVKQCLYRDAVKIARHVSYTCAGTVEFMVDASGSYYFLEVNPRIQVEHTITEEITGVDLVQAQILVAAGVSLAEMGLGTQEDIPPPNGFAIQCRVTSEDPTLNFQPDVGRLEVFRVPGGPGIRLDGAMAGGNSVSRYYDSLLSKVIASGTTYQKAVSRMQRALAEFQVRGVKTNIGFLENVFRHPVFQAGAVTTKFIEQYGSDLFNLDGNMLYAQGSKLLQYLGEMKVNGPSHAGAIGPPPAKVTPVVPPVPKGPPPPGWRDLLQEKGPQEWAKAVRSHQGLLLTDTTMRDAHQSLLATRMRTYDMLKVAPATSNILAPLASLEMWGGATFDVSMRFLSESPWKRLEELREAIPNIPFQMLLRGANAVGYTSYPDNVVRAFTQEAKRSGIDIFRVFDSLNYLDNLKFGIDAVAASGGVVEGTICYTGDLSDPTRDTYRLEYYMAMAEALVEHGIHTLAIKDMAGLLKPQAATTLISTLRDRFPDLVLHVHTHDTAGTGVATQLAAAHAGADIVDTCVDSMSGTTSQPAMGPVLHATRHSPLDTGVDPDSLIQLNQYWEATRQLYSPFEQNIQASSSDVYMHEMPGGQFTNLKFQASQLGLGSQWDKVKLAYAQANRALGDIVKVTPSSKVVGDLAQFMVQNQLDEASLLAKADQLSLPQSVVEFMMGYIGQPPNGWPEPLRSKILRGRKPIEGRPGRSMPPLNLYELEGRLQQQYGPIIDSKDVLSAALYPKVFDEFMESRFKYGRQLERLPTRSFLAPLEEDEEIEVHLERGSQIYIKYKAMGELQADGKREVFFEVNGVPRQVEITDAKRGAALSKEVREKADVSDAGSLGAPMSGEVVEVCVQPRSRVEAGQQLVVMSAMKMETAVCAPLDGVIAHVAVVKGDVLDAGDLVVRIMDADSVDEEGNGTTQGAQEVASNVPA